MVDSRAMNDATPRKVQSGPTAAEPNRNGMPDVRTMSSAVTSTTKRPVISSVEEVLRIFEDEGQNGILSFDAKALHEGLKAFLDKNRAAGPEGSQPPVFTARHLDILFGDLTRSQKIFLTLLLREPGRLVSREELASEMTGGTGNLTNFHSLIQAAHLLRRRLGPAGRCIETISGVGFRWNRKKESKELSHKLFRVLGLSSLATLAVVAGLLRFSRGSPDGGPPTSPPTGTGTTGPFQAMRDFSSSGPFGEPSASVAHAKGHSPWRTVDGSADTWFEGVAPARAGDWLAFRFPAPFERSDSSAPVRRIEILFGRPESDGSRVAPPCRVECSAGASGAASETWIPLGNIEPSAGRFVVNASDLPVSSIVALRIVVTADSDFPLVVREAGFADSGMD